MIRPLTLLTLLAASGAGLHLYKVKHEVALLDRELAQIQAQTEAAKARTGILKAEWQLLNEPERLRRNVEQYLPLETMQPGQFIRAADIDKRLPQAVAFAGPRNRWSVPRWRCSPASWAWQIFRRSGVLSGMRRSRSSR